MNINAAGPFHPSKCSKHNTWLLCYCPECEKETSAHQATTVTEADAIAAYDVYRNAVAAFKQHEPWSELVTFKKGGWFAVVRMIRFLDHERGKQ